MIKRLVKKSKAPNFPNMAKAPKEVKSMVFEGAKAPNFLELTVPPR